MTRTEGLDPAFPIPTVVGLPNGEILYGFNGVTIRDYFAGKALQGIAQHVGSALIMESKGVEAEDISRACYYLADAMIEERAKV